jgi:hypothetical protein
MTLPPCRSTRSASATNAGTTSSAGQKDVVMQATTSAERSAHGSALAEPAANDTLRAPIRAAFRSANARIARFGSTPTTSTARAASSNVDAPEPEPTSITIAPSSGHVAAMTSIGSGSWRTRVQAS